MEEARKIILDTLANLAKEPPTKEEVDRARTRLLTQIDLQLLNSEQIGLTISDWLSRGDRRLLFSIATTCGKLRLRMYNTLHRLI